MELRELTTIEEFRRVVALEQRVWEYSSMEDAVPVPILIVSRKAGGLVIGAFDEGRELVGFAYSLPGFRNGVPLQWSHMLGVAETHRNQGVGCLLKLEQRRLTLAMGLGLIEWTFDPLQAPNAHFNFVKLGAVAREYHLDVYGESSSALHRGTPTDRLLVEWWLQSARVEKRLQVAGREGHVSPDLPHDLALVNEVVPYGRWVAPGSARLSLDTRCLLVAIPTGFTEMQRQDVGLAREWRAVTREIFSTYLSCGYEVRDFRLEREMGRGSYLLSKPAV